MYVYGALDGLLYFIGFLFGVAGFLSVTGISDFGVELASATQLHALPLLSSLSAGWAYLIVGVVLIAIASAIYGRRVIDLN